MNLDPITVRVVPYPPSGVVVTCLAYPRSIVWWKLRDQPIGTRFESLGITYEKAEPA